MKKLIFFVWLSATCSVVMAQTTVLLHYLPTFSRENAVKSVGYDNIVVDPDVFFLPERVKNLNWLQEQNPKIKILAYANPIEMFVPAYSDKPWSINLLEFLKQIPEWWLRDVDGNIASFWPGTKMLNCSINLKPVKINGQSMNYIEFFSDTYISSVLKNNPCITGMVGDNIWDEGVYWMRRWKDNGLIDLNNDGMADDSASIDRAWSAGLAYFLDQVRQNMGPEFTIISNPANSKFKESVSGKMMEDFSDRFMNEKDSIYDAWYENLALTDSLSGPFIFNARPDNYWFTLCSTMLADNVWFSYAKNTPYDKKWELHLGKPLARRVQVREIVFRLYENGTVYVNPRDRTAWVTYTNGDYRDQ